MLLVFFKKLGFMLFMERCFFLLIRFWAVQDYELPKSTSYILSVPLNLECVRILSWSVSFLSYFSCLPNDVLCKTSIWADDNALNSSCDKPSDLPEKFVISSLKEWKWTIRDIRKCNLHPFIYWYLGNYSIFIILYIQANP